MKEMKLKRIKVRISGYVYCNEQEIEQIDSMGRIDNEWCRSHGLLCDGSISRYKSYTAKDAGPESGVGRRIKCPDDVADIMCGSLTGLPKEETWALFVDRANRVKSLRKFTQGTSTRTMMDTKGILRQAIMDDASGVILVHNHPSGSAKPSKADITETEGMKKACEVFQIRLLDHIIIGDGVYYSFSDEKASPIR